jgi:hypothetical protein
MRLALYMFTYATQYVTGECYTQPKRGGGGADKYEGPRRWLSVARRPMSLRNVIQYSTHDTGGRLESEDPCSYTVLLRHMPHRTYYFSLGYVAFSMKISTILIFRR